MTDPPQVVDRTLDAPRWFVIGQYADVQVQELIPNQNGSQWVVKYATAAKIALRPNCVSVGLSLAINSSPSGQTNSALTQKYPKTADKIFDKHWQTWFTKADAQRLKGLGINTVRVPVSAIPGTTSGSDPYCIEAWLLAR